MHNNDNDLNVDEQIIASLEKCWRADRNIENSIIRWHRLCLISAISKNELKINSANTFSVIFDDSKIKYYKPRSEEKIH